MSSALPDVSVIEQINQLSPQKNHLVLCDVDEVVVQFVAPLEKFFLKNGYRYELKSYALTGNVFHLEDGKEASPEQVSALVVDFFQRETLNQPLVPQAKQALNRLADLADIVFLTNIPHENRNQRAEMLARNGLNFPVVSNTGSKGRAAAAIAAPYSGKIIFLDDAPPNLFSVKKAIPEAIPIHFMADTRFFPFMGEQLDITPLRCSEWNIALDFISPLLNKEHN